MPEAYKEKNYNSDQKEHKGHNLHLSRLEHQFAVSTTFIAGRLS